MTDHQRNELPSILSQMSEEEKHSLAQELLKSLQRRNAETEAGDAQPELELDSFLARIEGANEGPEPADGLSGTLDHDQILYDGTSDRPFPERPRP